MSEDLLGARRAKLDGLRADGIDPFPHSFAGRHADRGGPRRARRARGRRRDRGRACASPGAWSPAAARARWPSSTSRTARAACSCSRRSTCSAPEKHELLLSLDLGDLIGIDGRVFKSRRGELSVQVEDFAVLAKSLRPPPDKFHGVQDVELRFRKRELDLMANPETRELFLARAKAVTAIRRYFDDEGFVEVETPVLQPLYGGALARPFVTHHNQLDRDLYLRIATELYLKRLIVGGLERVYEIGKNFRNEGVSHKHNPEFTMIEWYEAYADYEDAAKRLEARRRRGRRGGRLRRRRSTSRAPWRRVTLRDAVREATGHRRHGAARRRRARGRDRRPDPDRGPVVARSSSTTSSRSSSSRGSSSRRSSWTTRRRSRRSPRTTAPSPGSSSGGRRSRRHGDRQRVHRAQRPRRAAARASRTRRGSRSAATRRPSRTTRRSSRRSSRACRRPAASGWASTGS